MVTVDFGRAGLQPGERILDVGCGSGRHMGEAARCPGTLTIGVDINRADLEAALERMALLKEMGALRGAWCLGMTDIAALPFPEGTFDLVICSEVLEHVPNHRAAFAELVRVLKPGGRLVVSVPRYLPEKICWMLSRTYRSTPGGHIRIYGEKRMRDLIAAADVALEGRHWAHSLHAPFWWLKCLVGLDRDDALPVRLYHRLLVWDLMRHPPATRFIERLLNPVMGKSTVYYGRKNRAPASLSS